MCTVSWIRGVDGFELFCNRDEQRTRSEALPPKVRSADDPAGSGSTRRTLYPLDPDGGGTWISANDAGLALCLLNNYQAADPRVDRPTSRGELVRGLASAPGAAAVRAELERIDPGHFRGFQLLVLEPGGGADESFVAFWDGRRLDFVLLEEASIPLISSGFDLPRVERARREAFERRVAEAGELDTALLSDYHGSCEPEPGPLAVLMERPDARTVSHTRVSVTSDEVWMHYMPVPEDLDGPVVGEAVEVLLRTHRE